MRDDDDKGVTRVGRKGSPDQRRAYARLRGRRATEQRLRRLRNEPLCRICASKGIVRASAVPDHIKPLSQGGSDDDNNIRCLCHQCHRDVTAEQFRYRTRQSIDDDGW